MPIAKIRQLSHTDTRGTNVLGMVQGLEKMGFNAKGVKGGDRRTPVFGQEEEGIVKAAAGGCGLVLNILLGRGHKRRIVPWARGPGRLPRR